MASFPEVGDTVGVYRIVGMLGRGPTGVVYEAFDARLSRSVALKVFDPQLSGDAEFRAQLAQEADELIRLNSLHIVQVYDHGEQDGLLFVVTQLIQDGDLGGYVIANGLLSPTVAVSVVGQLCEALPDAERAGLRHRGIKPSNVLVRDRGSVLYAYLADFGVAASENLETYVDAPDEVSALGAVLWFALTGAPPVGPAPQVQPDGDGAARLNQVLGKALAQNPADRYPSVGELAAALAALGTLPPTARAAATPVLEPVPVIEQVKTVVEPRPLFADEVEPEPDDASADEPVPDEELVPEQLLGWRARRAAKRALTSAPVSESELEPEPEPEVEPEPALSTQPERKADRRRWDLGWLLPGGLLLVLPIVVLVGVFILVNGQGGSNYGHGATTPPQVVTAGKGFTLGAFTAQTGWQVGAGPLWQINGLVVENVAAQADDAHFTLTIKKGRTVLSALDCRTGELQPKERQTVSCDDLSNAAFDPAWDQVTVEEAF